MLARFAVLVALISVDQTFSRLSRLLSRKLLALAGALIIACSMAESAAAKPNIVLIVTDDMEVGLVAHMPVLKRLIIDQGATFERAYFNYPLCCPSRANLLTGKYAQNTKVTGQSHAQFFNNGNPDRTFAVWLTGAGYRTALTGKYLNGYPSPASSTYVPPGWFFWVGKKGGDLYYDYPTVEKIGTDSAKSVSYGSDPASYSTDVFGGKALQFVDQSLKAGVPFQLVFTPQAPHAPHTPAPRHTGLFPGLKAPKPASFNEADVSDKPAYVRQKPLLTSGEITTIDKNYRLRAQSLQAVEEIIQNLFDRIDAAGQLNNTYFVFISDNGWLYGQHRLRTKNFPYEETVRMPLYVRGPGITAGRRITTLVTIADLAPTFAAWAGASVPADLDGRSLAGLLTGGSGPNRKVVAMKSPSHSQNWRAVRTATHTYVRYLATGEQELYDNVTDPLQLQNLAKQSSSKALLDALEKRSAALATCKAQGCHSLEDAALQ